ncbi:glycoside hydrolase family 1 protein [Nocardioides sp.]|uniref:glycoside hydrolase family 1 protein n=1 Tax=Nocardioides sp. TaxID=35761 RepID=UPI0039E5B3C7
MPLPSFPPGFRLGTSAAAYLIEGATTADGRGRSTWDVFAEQPGVIADGSDATVAADHYHRMPEDVGLIARLGDHRFGVSWARVLPTGRGRVNPAGLDFYDRLVDRLLNAGVRPTATLYAGDLPQELEADGGWLNRSTVDAFAEYAAVVAARLGDRVEEWVPVQDPNVSAYLGYGLGTWAPGRRLGFAAVAAVHHLLLAHGRAAIALRAAGAARVGCATQHQPIWPASEDPADVGAAKLVDGLWNGVPLEAMLFGRYPDDLVDLFAGVTESGDLATIRQPLDFYGLNYYAPQRIGAAPEGADLPFELRELLGYPSTDVGWAIVPAALREWLITTRARHRAALPPFVITQCGAAFDVPVVDGEVDDRIRIAFLSAHLEAVAAAIQRGVDIRGFYAYTPFDCWDWEEGMMARYGLVHVDRTTLERTPKRSFGWYADLVAAHRSPA